MSDVVIKRGPSGETPLLGYDPTKHALIPLQVVGVTQDSEGRWYGVLNVNASFSATSLAINDANTPANTLKVLGDGSINTNTTVTPAANQRVNLQSGDAVAGSIVDLLTLLTLAGTPTDANTVASFMGRLTKIRDLLNATLAVSVASLPLPSGAAKESGGNLDTIVTDLAELLLDTDNLATIAGAISSAKMQNNIAQVGGTTVDTNSGNKSAGTLRVVLATDQPALTNTQPVAQKVASSGGSVPYHNLSAASTNTTNVKGSACQLYSARLSNTSGSVIYVRWYDKTTAPTTSDTPKDTVMVPANALVPLAFPEGMVFSTGFGWSATGGVADNDATNIAANCIIDFSLNS